MMKKLIICGVIAIVFLFTAGLSMARAAEFSADMVQQKDGETSTSRLFVKGSMYRMEMEQEGRGYAEIVDRNEGTTTLLSPEEKQYMKLKNSGFRSMTANPFESFWYHARTHESRELGKEEVNGYACSKVLVSSGERDLFTGWISEKLDFPLKIVFHLGKGTAMELQNIRQGPVAPALFEIPGDYTQRKQARSAKRKKPAGPERKDWMGKVGAAGLVKAPLEKEMQPGEIIRLKIGKGKAFDFFSMYSMRIYAFYEGEPVAKVRGATAKTYFSPVEADEMVIHYDAGGTSKKGRIRIQPGEMPERMLSAGEEMRVEIKGDSDPVCRFVNMNEEAATVYYTWLSQGKELPSSKIGPQSHRSKDLGYKGEARQIAFSGSITDMVDTLVVKVPKGRVLVKAGQPFRAKTLADTVQKPPESKPEPAGTKEKSMKAEPAASQTAGQSASRAATIMFILDASGSMWGEVEGRDKIAIAKEVMAKLIRDLPDNTRAGLVAYGHRRKGDCKDVEELVQMSPLDKEGIIRVIQGLSPKGKTPITYSVRVTAEKLRELEDETTIILVSDGKESCGGDPCALVRKLKTSGLRFTMQVIGFDVTEEERKQLACMAEAGGGRYFTAKTADEFETAAREVVQETRTVGFLEIMAFRNESPVRARVTVFKQDTGQRVKKVNTFIGEKKPEIIRLKPGTYTVVFTDEELPGNPSRSFSDVKIALDQTVSRTARFDAGILELSAIKEGKSIHAHAKLYQEDERVGSGWLEEGKGASFSLSPGVYRVEVTDKSIPEEPVVSLKDIEIRSGQSISRQANFSLEGELKIEALKAGKSIHVHARVYKGDDQVVSGWLEEGEGASFKLLPGVYRVEIQDKKIPQEPMVVLEDIEVQPGQTVSKQAQFVQEGQLRIEAFKGGKSIHVHTRVYKGDDQVASGWLDEGKGKTFRLLPGTYRFEIKGPDGQVKEQKGISIKSGQATDVDIQF